MANKNNLLIAALSIVLLLPSLSIAQENKSRQIPLEQMHHEKVEDPYLPNEFNNQKLGTSYHYSNNNANRSANSTITTTQVNISSSGQNIIGDAANEPSIAFSPTNPNNMVIGWRQFDNVSSNFRQAGYAYSTDAGATWTFPGVIEPGMFRSDPVLDYDDQGYFYYNSLTNTPTFLCTVFKSSDGGMTWGPGTPAKGGDKQWMAIDRTGGAGNGNIYSAWTYAWTSCDTGYYTASYNGNVSYDTCTTIPGRPYWLTMDVANSGDLYIAGNTPGGGGVVFVKSSNAQTPPGASTTWSGPVLVNLDGSPSGWGSINPQGLLGQVNLGIDKSNGPGQGNIYILCSVERNASFDPADVMFTRSTDGGQTWSPPIAINDDFVTTNTQWLGTMSVAPTGRIDVIWLDTRDAVNPIDESFLYYSYSTDQGVTWSVNEKLSAGFNPHLGYPNQNKMGDYLDMQSDSTSAHLAWCNTLNSEQDVYYSVITPPAITNIAEIQHHNIIVYPNPTSSSVEVSGISADMTVELHDVLGKVISTQVAQSTNAFVDISAASSGIYILKVRSKDGNVFAKKIIKE